jgi:acyl dehydratase
MMGLFMEQIALNARVALGSYIFTRENMLSYSLKFDPVGFHVDDTAGKASPYGAVTAAGLHVAAGWMRCFVDTNAKARAALVGRGVTLPELGPSPGFKNMKWLKPVYAGDELFYFTTAAQRRVLRSRPGWGIVSGFNEGVNRNGDLVFSFESVVLTASKN